MAERPESRLESLYDAAKGALLARAPATALPLLEQIAAEHPDYQDVTQLLERVRPEAAPAGDGPTPRPRPRARDAHPAAPASRSAQPDGPAGRPSPRPGRTRDRWPAPSPQPDTRRGPPAPPTRPPTRPAPAPQGQRLRPQPHRARRPLRALLARHDPGPEVVQGGHGRRRERLRAGARGRERRGDDVRRRLRHDDPGHRRGLRRLGRRALGPDPARHRPAGHAAARVRGDWQVVWDSGALYLRVHVVDPDVRSVNLATPGAWFNGDGFSFEFGPDARSLGPDGHDAARAGRPRHGGAVARRPDLRRRLDQPGRPRHLHHRHAPPRDHRRARRQR